MKTIKYFFFIVLLAFSSKLLSQDQTILIFDPNGVSTSFQYTLSQLTEDSVFVADSLDDSIFNYDAAFLFINYPYILSEEESNRLIQYTSDNMPAYIFSPVFFHQNLILLLFGTISVLLIGLVYFFQSQLIQFSVFPVSLQKESLLIRVL